MYGSRNGALSTLTDARDEIDSKLEEAREALNTIQDAISQLEDVHGQLETAIDALEQVDGLTLTVEVDAFEVDLSIDL